MEARFFVGDYAEAPLGLNDEWISVRVDSVQRTAAGYQYLVQDARGGPDSQVIGVLDKDIRSRTQTFYNSEHAGR